MLRNEFELTFKFIWKWMCCATCESYRVLNACQKDQFVKNVFPMVCLDDF